MKIALNRWRNAAHIVAAACVFSSGAISSANAQAIGSAHDLWSGVYAGVHVGHGVGEFDGIFDNAAINFGSADVRDSVVGRYFELEGTAFGAQLGINRTYNNVVFGLEFDWSNVELSSKAFDQSDEGPAGSTTDNATIDVNWLASLRGRVGYASANSLLYATFGLAWLDADYTANDLDDATPANPRIGTTDLDGLGFVVGAGMEHALSNGLSVRLEGLYYGFNQRQDTSTLVSDADTGDFAELKDILVARVGVNYAFSRSGGSVGDSAAANWNGFYVGGHGGYSAVSIGGVFDSSEIDNPFDNENSVFGRHFHPDGANGGIQAGYNFASGGYVVGIEADWTYLGQSDHQNQPNGGALPVDNAGIEVDWIASLRARAGIESARSLFYLTAGVAWVGADYTAVDVGGGGVTVGTGSTGLNDTGFVFGGGMEHAFDDRLRIRMEALHYQFGTRVDTSGLTPDSDVGDFAGVDDISTVRIGLSYRLNGE